MAIDETGLIGGEFYTILLNKEKKGKKGCLAALIKGTKGSHIARAIKEKVDFQTRMKVREITLDMANNMDWIVRETAPNACRTYDRFHVQKLVCEAVQNIRVKLRWEAIDLENEEITLAKQKGISYRAKTFSNGDTTKQLLARSRYFLFKPKDQWYQSQIERARILFKEFPLLKKAYNYYIYFRNCYEINNKKYNFKNWIKDAYQSKIKEIISVARTIENHLGGINNYFFSHATNANIESFNAKLKLFRQNTRGVVDKDFFFFRIINYFA